MIGADALALRDRNNTAAGFTLIEMLVALALLSLIAGLLAGGVKSSRNVLALVERLNAASAVLPAQNYLRQALAQTVPTRVTTLSGDLTPGLAGNATQVRFKTLYAPHGQLGGLYRIDVHLEPAPGSYTTYDLIATQTLIRPEADGGPPQVGLRSTLASHVTAVSLRYFGAEDSDPALFQWLPEWSSDRLPRLVRFDVIFAPAQPQIWQRIYLPLQLSN